MVTRQGSTKEFDKNWVGRPEALRSHWSKGAPKHQIELAFQQHFSFIQEVIGLPKKGSVLDVGSGRGSMGAFFADAGYKVTLLDSSSRALKLAERIFSMNGHSASYTCNNVLDMSFADNSFDVVVSIGLLEHFKDITAPIREQLRVLKPGGTFIAYVIPYRDNNVQALFQPLNKLLEKFSFMLEASSKQPKQRVYRNTYNSKRYVRYLKQRKNVTDVNAVGIYPFPELSYSPSFPFSVLPKIIEKSIVGVYERILDWRRKTYKQHPWICEESLGQGFMIWCKKVK